MPPAPMLGVKFLFVFELLTAVCSTFLCTLGLPGEENKYGSRATGGEHPHIFH